MEEQDGVGTAFFAMIFHDSAVPTSVVCTLPIHSPLPWTRIHSPRSCPIPSTRRHGAIGRRTSPHAPLPVSPPVDPPSLPPHMFLPSAAFARSRSLLLQDSQWGLSVTVGLPRLNVWGSSAGPGTAAIEQEGSDQQQPVPLPPILSTVPREHSLPPHLMYEVFWISYACNWYREARHCNQFLV